MPERKRVPMSRETSAERDYLLRRASEHRDQAAAADTVEHQALHRRFAALYQARADELGVQEH